MENWMENYRWETWSLSQDTQECSQKCIAEKEEDEQRDENKGSYINSKTNTAV